MTSMIIAVLIIASAAPVGAMVGIWMAKKEIRKMEREKEHD